MGRPPRGAVSYRAMETGLFLVTPALLLLAYWVSGRLQPGKPGEAGFSPRQHRVRRLSQALAAAGAVQLVAMLFRHTTWTIDDAELAFASLAVGASLVALLWIVELPSGSRRALGRWAALGLFGAVSSSAALLRDINQGFDFAPAVAREVRILGMSTSSTLRGGTSYYLRLEDWTNEGAAREVDLSRRQYHGYAVGRSAAFDEHRGCFGIRWIDGLRPASQDEVRAR